MAQLLASTHTEQNHSDNHLPALLEIIQECGRFPCRDYAPPVPQSHEHLPLASYHLSSLMPISILSAQSAALLLSAAQLLGTLSAELYLAGWRVLFIAA